MNWDFSKAGALTSIEHGLKIIGWIALSGAVAALINFVGGLHFDPSNITAVASVGLINAILASLLKWVNTKQ